MRFALPALLLAAALAGCASDGRSPPSLAPRAAEAIDPRLPIIDRSGELPADPALLAQLQDALARARAAAGRAEPAIATARSAVGSAGARGSESWISAQQLVSVAVAAREPFTTALGDFDRLISARIAGGERLVPRDIAAAREAAASLSELDRRQGEELSALQARLR